MDKKKLIGTIIGVTLFAALIAGATFAWLTFAVNVTNGTYTANTMEFVINYTGGTNITEVPVLSTANATSAAKTGITAYRSKNSPNGILYFKMSITSNNILSTSGVLKYAVCKGTSTAGTCTSDFTTANVATDANLLAVGEINTTDIVANSDGEYTITLHTMNNIAEDVASGNAAYNDRYYWVYYWMNGAEFTNDMISTDPAKPITFSGYIHASAEQR